MLILVSFDGVVLTTNRMSDTETNSVGPMDTYTLYKQMMDMKNRLILNSTSIEKPEPETITRLRNALSLLYDALVEGLFFGFVPHFLRERREARERDRNYLDLLVTIIGALLGRQDCSQLLACRWCAHTHLHLLSLFQSRSDGRRTRPQCRTGDSDAGECRPEFYF